jgi:hypothetical protein
MSRRSGTPSSAAFVEALLDLFLEDLGHPDHAQQAAVADDELALGDVELGMAHKTRRDAPPPMTPARVVNFIPQGVSPA